MNIKKKWYNHLIFCLCELCGPVETVKQFILDVYISSRAGTSNQIIFLNLFILEKDMLSLKLGGWIEKIMKIVITTNINKPSAIHISLGSNKYYIVYVLLFEIGFLYAMACDDCNMKIWLHLVLLQNGYEISHFL